MLHTSLESQMQTTATLRPPQTISVKMGVLGFGACGNTSASISDDSIRSTVRTLGTAGLLWLSGIESEVKSIGLEASISPFNHKG